MRHPSWIFLNSFNRTPLMYVIQNHSVFICSYWGYFWGEQIRLPVGKLLWPYVLKFIKPLKSVDLSFKWHYNISLLAKTQNVFSQFGHEISYSKWKTMHYLLQVLITTFASKQKPLSSPEASFHVPDNLVTSVSKNILFISII